MSVTYKISESNSREIKLELEPHVEYCLEVTSGLTKDTATRHNLGVILGKDVNEKIEQLDNKCEIRVFELSTVISWI